VKPQTHRESGEGRRERRRRRKIRREEKRDGGVPVGGVQIRK
jgi:hypothetical protein